MSDFETEYYQLRPDLVWAGRIDSRNIERAAEKCGGQLFSYARTGTKGEPFILLETLKGNIKVKSGMWLVYNGRTWVGMTDHNFHKKYEKWEAESSE